MGRGEVISVQVACDLSTVWYAGRMDPDWTPTGPAGAEQTFQKFGLTGEFWALT